MKHIVLNEEVYRIYHYPGGETLYFERVQGLDVSSSGTHYLTLPGIKKAIVSPGWLWIELEAADWDD